ncbi:MAG: hypothetical protein D8M59_14215 [Planctomycetes bacterium]|nr:hypothetical protein [Planctomycetota bacterium]NOG55486.1 hypothetical protein [Planctomycetota bacterium]
MLHSDRCSQPRLSHILPATAAVGLVLCTLSGCGMFKGNRSNQQAATSGSRHFDTQNDANKAQGSNDAAAAPVTSSDHTASADAGHAPAGPTGAQNEDYFAGSETTVAFNGHATDFDHTGSAGSPRPALNLFGEIDGVGGRTGPFGASENVTQVTFSVEGEDFNPDINSAGTHLIYASTQHSRTSDIYRKPVGGQAITQLTSDPADDIMPCYSPDDSQIAFVSNRNGNWDIFIMGTEGGTAVQVTDDPANEIHPSWSPDGQNLVFCRLGEQSGRWELWVSELATPTRKHFIGYGLFPEWNPDPNSNKIAFQRARQRGSRLFSVWTIDYVNGQGGQPTEVASAANAATLGPSWSCDGKLLAFSTIVDPDHLQGNTEMAWADIWVVSAEGTDRVNITNGEFTNCQPTWGPEGTMYFVSNRSGTDTIWAIEPNRAIDLARSGGAGSGSFNSGANTGTTELAEVPENAPHSGQPD